LYDLWKAFDLVTKGRKGQNSTKTCQSCNVKLLALTPAIDQQVPAARNRFSSALAPARPERFFVSARMSGQQEALDRGRRVTWRSGHGRRKIQGENFFDYDVVAPLAARYDGVVGRPRQDTGPQGPSMYAEGRHGPLRTSHSV